VPFQGETLAFDLSSWIKKGRQYNAHFVGERGLTSLDASREMPCNCSPWNQSLMTETPLTTIEVELLKSIHCRF
jgi:hypothetical protein